ncbi:hypothetical protein C0995_009932 [Termitomyces sp. Mi166|nr:hypothetical protein C0995_009932 [Termitomyces sp. Mi166\
MWLLENGYTLYLRYPSEGDYAFGMYPVNSEHKENIFPFANHEGPEPDDESLPTLYGYTGFVGNIAFAQNTEGQHVAFKAVLDGSEEFRILEYLHNQGVPRSIDDFHHVIPVLDVLPFEGHWLAVMPRTSKRTTYSLTMSTLITMIIATTTVSLYVFKVPGDTLQGEFDFNPFPFDVGMLGVMFCKEFQHMTRTVPMLAPLFDRMTTRDITRRFKASEALQFFEEHVIPLTPKHVLSLAAPGLPYSSLPYDYYDRWESLDPDFVKEWAAYREPPVPPHIRILREICLYPWVFHIVSSIRRIARILCRGWTILIRILPQKW